MNPMVKISDGFRALRERWDWVMTVSTLVFLGALINPAAPLSWPKDQPPAPWVLWVENKGRFLNTVMQVSMPVISRDIAGGVSLLWVTLLGTTTTHVFKRALNHVEIDGVRLGQRPDRPDSNDNFPSGHSSMSSSGAVFVARRYGLKWLWLLLPMTLATMYARVALDAHTWTATLAGAALGVLFTWPLCARDKMSYTHEK